MSRVSLRRRQLVLSIAGLFALGAVPFVQACGGGDSVEKVDTDEWVEQFCEELLDAFEETTELGAEYAEIDFDDGEDAQQDLLDITDDIIAESEALTEALNELGAPDIEGGEDVRDETIAHSEEVVERTQELRDGIADLDPDDNDFEDEVLELFEDMETGGYRDRLEELAEDNDEVEDVIDAIEDEEDCAAVAFSEDQPDAPSGDLLAVEEWTANACTIIIDHYDQISDLEDESFDLPVDDVDQLAEDYLGLVDQQVALTGQLGDDLAGVGTPDLEDGDEIASALLAGVNDYLGRLEDFRDDTAAISADDPADYIDQADELNFAFDGFDIQLAILDVGSEGAEEISGMIEDDEDCYLSTLLAPIYAPFAEEEGEPTANPAELTGWTTDMCSVMVAYSDDVDNLEGQSLSLPVENVNNLESGFLFLVDSHIARTGELRDELEELAPPDSDNGDDIVDAVLASIDKAIASLGDYRDSVEAVSATTSAEWVAAVEELNADFDGIDVQADIRAMGTPDAGEIANIIDQDEECYFATYIVPIYPPFAP